MLASCHTTVAVSSLAPATNSVWLRSVILCCRMPSTGQQKAAVHAGTCARCLTAIQRFVATDPTCNAANAFSGFSEPSTCVFMAHEHTPCSALQDAINGPREKQLCQTPRGLTTLQPWMQTLTVAPTARSFIAFRCLTKAMSCTIQVHILVMPSLWTSMICTQVVRMRVRLHALVHWSSLLSPV